MPVVYKNREPKADSLFLCHDINPPRRAMKIHSVSVSDERSVVVTITLDESTPSLFIFFAIM